MLMKNKDDCCRASFVKLSDEIAQHSALSSVVGVFFGILCESTELFLPNAFPRMPVFLLLKAPRSFINDEIRDIKDSFKFYAYKLNV